MAAGMENASRISSDQRRWRRSKSIDSVAFDGSALTTPHSRYVIQSLIIKSHVTGRGSRLRNQR